jgi:gliding motility-associated-like protein
LKKPFLSVFLILVLFAITLGSSRSVTVKGTASDNISCKKILSVLISFYTGTKTQTGLYTNISRARRTTTLAFYSENSTPTAVVNQNAGNDSLQTINEVSGNCSPGYIISDDTTFCTGSIMEFHSQPALSYQWLPSDLFVNSTIQNTYLRIDSTRTYYLETTDLLNNLVANPDFELGNTDFSTDYTYCNGLDCLKPLGDDGYTIGTDANFYHTNFTGHDHTSGAGNFMIVNGAQPSLTVWQQTISVKPFTKYAFGVWISTMISLKPAQIQFSINGAQIGELYNAPLDANKWDQVFATWNSGSGSSATIKIVDILPILSGNDFGLDDLFFGEVVTCRDSITVQASQNVNLGPDTLISPNQEIEIRPLYDAYQHFNWNTGDTTHSILVDAAGKYWLSVSDSNGCLSVDTITVKNAVSFLVFPDAFTPNADMHNDTFQPRSSNVSNFSMTIYNRWGQRLFETTSLEYGWDGTYKGELCPPGLYTYSASYKLIDTNESKTTRGSFIIAN